jgi:N-acetylglutamate synthase-like GNAT family acetyltransferase
VAAEPTVQAHVRRAKPSDIGEIVTFLNRVHADGPRVDRGQIMRSFADKGFMVADLDGALVSVIAWHVENLVACVEELYINPASLFAAIAPQVLQAIEDAATQLVAEAALIFIAHGTPQDAVELFHDRGYKTADLASMPRAWREAATGLLKPEMIVLVKQLRESRVTRPI